MATKRRGRPKQTPKKRHESRVNKYKQITGKQRISKAEREALKYAIPSVVAKKGVNKSSFASTYQRRLSQYERRHGEATKEARELLKYISVGKAEKALGYEKPGDERKQKSDEGTNRVELGTINYARLPYVIKKHWLRQDYRHWMYIVKPYYRDVDLDYMARTKNAYYGDDAIDHTNKEFLDLVVRERFPGVIVNKNEDGTYYFVKG